MLNDLRLSYSFSLQLKLCQDIRYYKKTTFQNKLNLLAEKFILNLIKNIKKDSTENPVRGRPHRDKQINNINKYVPFQFSLKNSTIDKIKEHKKNGNVPNLDKNLEEHLRLIVPCREIR